MSGDPSQPASELSPVSKVLLRKLAGLTHEERVWLLDEWAKGLPELEAAERERVLAWIREQMVEYKPRLHDYRAAAREDKRLPSVNRLYVLFGSDGWIGALTQAAANDLFEMTLSDLARPPAMPNYSDEDLKVYVRRWARLREAGKTKRGLERWLNELPRPAPSIQAFSLRFGTLDEIYAIGGVLPLRSGVAPRSISMEEAVAQVRAVSIRWGVPLTHMDFVAAVADHNRRRSPTEPPWFYPTGFSGVATYKQVCREAGVPTKVGRSDLSREQKARACGEFLDEHMLGIEGLVVTAHAFDIRALRLRLAARAEGSHVEPLRSRHVAGKGSFLGGLKALLEEFPRYVPEGLDLWRLRAAGQGAR